MEITNLDNKSTIKLSQDLLQELNNTVSKIVSDNSIEDPLAIEKIILSLDNKRYEFEILIDDTKVEKIEIEQINHRPIITEE